MLKGELLEILVCPKCKGELEYDKKNEELSVVNTDEIKKKEAAEIC